MLAMTGVLTKPKAERVGSEVAGAQDIVDQIEYRWHDKRDFSPFASTMSAESLRGWDSRIRTWVRHPHVDGLRESLCYQVQPNGYAALAWRYEDWPVAGRASSMRRRPLVSRVLVGQASLLTPEVAIVLCHSGLPLMAGPRPGQVTTETELSVLKAGELSDLVTDRTDGLDEEAARQEGLLRVVAAALSDPDSPLAIYLGNSHILTPPGEGLQYPLLWGLRRSLWPLLSTAGRGWSFSTFEPPLGGMNPAALPDILFRQAQGTRPTRAATRREVESRPFDPSTPDDEGFHAQLAASLVAEYRKRGGDELGQLIAELCGAERSPQVRLRKVHDGLRAKRLPSVPPRIFMSYRREETGWAAGRLFDSLASRFGRDQVFKDVDSIEPGDNFVEVITTAVGSCHVFLALIGNRWLTINDQEGRRRLDDPSDFVRLEIEAALERGIRVIPVLVDGTRMPRADQLPGNLAGLARRQGLKLSQDHFGGDFQRLLPALQRAITAAQEQTREHAEEALRRRLRIEQLRERLRERAAAQDWDGVVALSGELAELDQAAADPDGLASTARQRITRRRQAEEVEARRRLRIEQLRVRLHKQAAAQDWDAVVALSRELPELGPAAGDLNVLARTAREQIARRQQAERTGGTDPRQAGLAQPQADGDPSTPESASPELPVPRNGVSSGQDAPSGRIGARPAPAQRRIGARPAPAQRRIGTRRGRSNDHRLWLGLGSVVVVATAAIAGIVKFEFLPSHSGPVHEMTTPAKIGTFTRTVDLERQANMAALREEVINTSSGQASHVVSAVYESGNSATGNDEQIIMFIGGHLANADPAASVASFTRQFKGAKVVSAGALGGKAACVQDGTGLNATAMCAWFDNDSFGEIVSPTMNTIALAAMINTIRPSVEVLAKN